MLLNWCRCKGGDVDPLVEWVLKKNKVKYELMILIPWFYDILGFTILLYATVYVDTCCPDDVQYFPCRFVFPSRSAVISPLVARSQGIWHSRYNHSMSFPVIQHSKALYIKNASICVRPKRYTTTTHRSLGHCFKTSGFISSRFLHPNSL